MPKTETMPETETLTLTLPVELLAAVRSAVEQGTYESTEDVIADALLDWKSVHVPNESDWDVEHIRKACEESAADPRPPLPMDEVFDRLKARYSAMPGSETGTRA